MAYFRRRFRSYRPRVIYKRPRRNLGYGSRRMRRRFYRCRSNGGSWGRCKRVARWKPYTWEKATLGNQTVYRKVPREGWTTEEYSRTRWVRIPKEERVMTGVS